MTTKTNGGPIYPVATSKYEDGTGYGHWMGGDKYQFGGMTLRDYFAVKAMPVVWADIPEDIYRDQALEQLGVFAYEMADAMLKARES